MPDMTRADALDALGLRGPAPEAMIRKAWKDRVFEMHPDRGGSDQDLARVNAAYRSLKTLPRRTATPSRPAVLARLIPVSAEDQAAARAKLAETGEGPGHVPEMLSAEGRRLTFIVSAEMAPGRNRVALPTRSIDGARRGTTRLLTFVSETGGPGELQVPEAALAEIFPGARSVTVHFGKVS